MPAQLKYITFYGSLQGIRQGKQSTKSASFYRRSEHAQMTAILEHQEGVSQAALTLMM